MRFIWCQTKNRQGSVGSSFLIKSFTIYCNLSNIAHTFFSCSFERPTEKGFLTGRDNPNAKASLIGLLLIRESIHQILGLPYQKIKLLRTQEGKPYLVLLDSSIFSKKPFTFFNFNISHSGKYVVCVTEPHWLVGVDIMSITTHPPQQNCKFLSHLLILVSDVHNVL
jgi:phosphopantetheinyl transferase